ncbi:cation diffusion facilitator family transporter [Tissierella sp. Yu-01]|uniref:cation diffusion facilitator family transporter n=1 Tax=Tissierella sp. Yu-01 TaxID=3035694 RepID=UPI00240CEA87|nr:cation diffusion facilitator family transporter [Tissierella sp. Yu-01]WFA08206.1 cation diffusion facilitator family transporter [Tissierella sp. Yu-01]
MITNYLLNVIIKEPRDYSKKETRTKVAYLASIVGLVANIFLSVIKLIIGILISSVSVIADGINNLSDAASSIITLIGFRLSNMPPDKEHPYGHGRIEYISALMVAFMVILVGFQFIRTSYDRIINPHPVKFEAYSFVILILSIIIKMWLSRFNYSLGEKINATGLKATATDALGDVLTTSVVLVSIIVGRFTTLPIDGIIGIIVSLLIMYNGYNLVKDTISPLIGEAPDEDLIRSINMDILTYDYIIGTHDLFIHSYGAGRTMATVDVEFPADVDNITIHEVIDRMERELGEKYDITLVVHMDPLGPETKESYELRKNIKRILKADPIVKSIHDFQLLEKDDGKEIEFHLVIDGNKISKTTSQEDLKADYESLIREKCTDKRCNLIVDIEY